MGNETTKKPDNWKRKLARGTFALIFIVTLLYIAYALISEGELSLPQRGLFKLLSSDENVREYHFDVGRSKVLADLDGAVAAAGSLGVQVLDLSGNERLRDPFRMYFPAIKTSGGKAIAYDVGGTVVRVFDHMRVIASMETNGPIVSASVNNNGWFAVCLQEGGGYRGSVIVYNDRGGSVYRVDLASGYVLTAEVSPDNKNLAILALTDFGGRIVFYSLDSEVAGETFDLPGELIVDIQYLTSGNVLAITVDSLIIVDNNGTGRYLYEYFDRRLGGYAVGDGLVALHLLDYGVGHSGRLVTFSGDGNMLGQLYADREVISLSVSDGYLAVLGSDGPVLYDEALESVVQSGLLLSAAGATKVLALNGGMIVAYGDHSSAVFRVAD